MNVSNVKFQPHVETRVNILTHLSVLRTHFKKVGLRPTHTSQTHGKNMSECTSEIINPNSSTFPKVPNESSNLT